ncbi:MAG: hypothetical protein LKH74_07580 [Levilactobacillus sp.]|jgi:hypothetical protein|uniref:DUF6681 family protein n=1 Tax=Levilactobacillus sp. TaxID=2767919 RepID=UPI002587C9DE|nr:DUF6681 family protein [Levilactobacillus sp.]MCH4123679.1 hypothetical protein [Levilactobacillus sp.]MCI1553777.1 hypothetical protein [Levilactobacillus sp.]MCI1599797.1 hypothetical protein [Levilactobacillus sp.]MCI1605383.1 hypothetical protein [Levilactobacillus sp.]
MLSFLDMVNHYLGYINVNAKIKNRIYVIIGALGDLYLFYIGFRYLQNGHPFWGLLILLVALILLYFVYLNTVYYFTEKKAPFDISPKIEKWLHIKPKEAEETTQPMRGGRNIPANGYFDEKKILPGKLTATASDAQNVQNLATRLQQNQLLQLDYSGLGDREIMEQTRKTGKPVYASGPAVLIPYFEMQTEGHQLVVYAGINQAEKQRVGVVSTVGLQDVADVRDQFELYLANATLVGGPFKVLGRTSLIEQPNEFQVAVQLAYKHHDDRPATARYAQRETPTETSRQARYDATATSDEPMTRTSRYHH